MTRTATQPETAGAWGDTAAVVRLSSDAAATALARDTAAASARLTATIAEDGVVFFQRVKAELDAAAACFNHRIGQPILASSMWPSGVLSVSDGALFVQVVPILSEGGQCRPGAVVTTDDGNGRLTQSHEFELDRDALVLTVHGEMCLPERLARVVLESWLTRLPTDGR